MKRDTEKNRKKISWVKKHKKKLIAAGLSVGGLILIFSMLKNKEHTEKLKDKILMILSSVSNGETNTEIEALNEPEPVHSSVEITDDIKSRLTEKNTTATALGSKVGVSGKEFNNILIESGIVERTPCGDLNLTETGKIFGEPKSKTTRFGYDFVNIEYDPILLEVLKLERSN